ncbi:hypothetical protein ACTFIU_002350 [Dictyostelium citrinum]
MTIIIQFDSTQEYNNYECGGSLEILLKNGTFWQNKTNQYPPCKSFYDASQRISQYNNYLKQYRNVKTNILLNYDWRNVQLKPTSGFYIQNNCFFQIKVLNDNDSNAIISIDGQNLNYLFSFITIDYNVNNELYCDNDFIQEQQQQEQQQQQQQQIIPVRLKLENFKLINFDNEFIRVTKFYKDFKFKNQYQFVSFQLNSIITSKSKFLMEFISYDYDFQIQYLINDCHFSNTTSDTGFILFGYSPFIVNNCTFNNIKNGYPIINTFNLSITNCSFNDIIINNNNKPMIQIGNFGSFNTIKVNGFTSTTFLYQSLDSITFNDSSIKLSNIQIKFNNNNYSNNYLLNIINNNNNNNNFNNYIQFNQIYINNKIISISILNTSKSLINVDNDSLNSFLLNSNLLFNGTNNIIILNNKNITTTQQQLDFINNLNNCSDCLFSINGNNISTIIKKDSSEFKLDSNSDLNKGFNKIFLIPIILGAVSIIPIILILLFKFKIIKKSNQDNDNDINEEPVVVGEIVMN